ncbi:hypothetical protein K8S19_09070 [bacterium]|nr:hypothetical protein [bacterium]
MFVALPAMAATISLHITVLGTYHEHFAQSSGQQPDGWTDETNDGANNAELAANGLGSAKLTKVDANNSGQAVSANMTMDLDTFDTLRVVVTEVDSTDYIVSLLLDGQSTPVRISTALTGTGIYEYDIKTITGWSGIQTFAIVLTVESATNGLGTRFDELVIYEQGSYTPYLEHFEEAAGQPGGWWDETNDSSNNAEIDGNGLDSAYVTEVGPDVWGKVLSDTMTLNLDTYGYLCTVVTAVDSGTSYKVSLKLSSGPTLYDLYAGNGTGKYCFDIKAATSWSGSQTFSIVLISETGTNGLGARFDEIKIDRIGF